MADTKAEITQHRLAIREADEEASKVGVEDKKAEQIKKRISSIDIFRGLTVALMILVDDAGGEWPTIGHAPWNGCHLADFVMPFFLFIVGMAIPLALKRIPNRKLAIRKVILRTLKLIFFGLLLQGIYVALFVMATCIIHPQYENFQNVATMYTSGKNNQPSFSLYTLFTLLYYVGGFSHAPDELSYGVDMRSIRWCGILQRIALAYLVVALMEIATRSETVKDLSSDHFLIFKSYIWHWLLGACVLIVYLAVLYGTYVPDWHFTVSDANSAHFGKTLTVSCNVRGKLDPPCNAVGYVDRVVMGISHMYHKPAWKRSKACSRNSPQEGPFLADAPSWCWAHFEPEGILSSISAILSTVIGVHFGHVLVNIKDHSSRLKHWIVMGLSLLLFGITLHFTHAIPLNKQLYTFSYVCVTSGAAALTFSTFYILVDIWKLQSLFLPFEWIGMNAMLVYVMAAEGIFAGFINGWYYKSPHNTLLSFGGIAGLLYALIEHKCFMLQPKIYWIQKHIFIGVWHSRRLGILLYVIFAEILFWAVVAGILHQLRIYWKL